MRLIQATVSSEALPDVKQALEAKDISYFMSHETGTDEYDTIIYVSIPEEEVEGVLESLYESGLDSDDHVVLINTEVDIFGRTDDGGASQENHARIASAELKGKTENLLPDDRTFVTMMVLSSIVATTGLLLDSAAVVVGSMVIAPLFGPAISTSAGTVTNEPDLFWNGIRLQVLGLVLSIASASLFAWIMKTAYLTPSGFVLTTAPQIVARLSPDFLSLVVALAAGIAGVFSIATATGRALVGVMMAAALLPPAATIGIGIAWSEPIVAINSSVLLLVNLLAINLAGLLTLWYLGYRPQSWIQISQTRRTLLKRSGVLFVAILVTSLFLWQVTYASVKRSQHENAIENDLSDLLDSSAYKNVTLVDVKVVQNPATLTHGIEKVIITIGRPPGERHPGLHHKINTRVEKQVGHEVEVDIHVSLVITEAQTR